MVLMRETAGREAGWPYSPRCAGLFGTWSARKQRKVQKHKARKIIWPKMNLGEEQQASSLLFFFLNTVKERSWFIAQTPWSSLVGICCPLSLCSVWTWGIGFCNRPWTALNRQGVVGFRSKEMIHFGLKVWESSVFLTYIQCDFCEVLEIMPDLRKCNSWQSFIFFT